MKNSVITVGTFDGVHLGHEKVLSVVENIAKKYRLTPLVITFDRHPLEIIAPVAAPKQIMSIESRNKRLQHLGMNVVQIPFDESLRRMNVRQWMEELKEKYGAKTIVLGYDNTFGSDGRQLNEEDYKKIARDLGLNLIVAPPIEGYSSTAVRRAVEQGRMDLAKKILGRWFSISGRVVEGKKLGRTIGFPTANISVDENQLLPEPGVYISEIEVDGRNYYGLVNVGVNPTVSKSGTLSIEAHLMGFKGDLYGKKLKIKFEEKIRDEKKFTSLEQLKTQIKKDISLLEEKIKEKP